MIRLRVQSERWPLAGEFRISRDSFTHSQMVVVELFENGWRGRGECEPHESDPAQVSAAMAAISAVEHEIQPATTPQMLTKRMSATPARNALDCALWDLAAKRSGKRVWELLGLPVQESLPTAYTIGIDTPERMASSAAGHAEWPLLKIKLGGETQADMDRIRAIRDSRGDARLIVDANGGWNMADLQLMAPLLHSLGVALIEQPLPAGHDQALQHYRCPVPLCADESCVDRTSLPHVIGKYQYINIKLDKTGGLTEALALAQAARSSGIGIMVGCMVGTSLAMAPAIMVAQLAEFVDLDGPVLLREDRDAALVYRAGRIGLPAAELWG